MEDKKEITIEYVQKIFDNVEYINEYSIPRLLNFSSNLKELILEKFGFNNKWKKLIVVIDFIDQYWFYDKSENIFSSTSISGLYYRTEALLDDLKNNTENLLYTYENYVAIHSIVPDNEINTVCVYDITKRITDLKTLQNNEL